MAMSPKANSSMGGKMNKLAGAMAPGNGMATRGAERALAKEPPGGHPTNDSGKVRMGGATPDRGGMHGGVGNNAGLGDAVRHLGKHHSNTGVAYQVGTHKVS